MEENKVIDNDEISLKELLLKIKEWYSYLLSQWKIIVLAGVIGAGLGLIYSFIKKPVYTATLTFALEDEKSGGIGGLGSLAGSFGLDLGGNGGSVFSGSNLNEFFKSRAMVQRALLSEVTYKDKKISLAEMYFQLNGSRKKWNESEQFKSLVFLPNVDPGTFTRVQDSIMTGVYSTIVNSALTVSQKDKKVAITSVEVKSENELFSQYLNEALVQEVCDFYIDTRSKKARENMAILQRQLDSVRGQLNGSISRVAVVNDNTFNLNPALNIRRAPAARSQVDVQTNTAILTELVKQSELAKVALRKETPLIQVIDRPVLPLTKEKFGKAKGIVLGGILAGFLSVSVLIVKRILK